MIAILLQKTKPNSLFFSAIEISCIKTKDEPNKRSEKIHIQKILLEL